MELSNHAKLELRELLNNTKVIYDNPAFLSDIYDIFKSEFEFFSKTSYDDKKYRGPACFDTKKRIFFVSPINIYFYAKKLALQLTYKKEIVDVEELTKEFILFVMMHEAVHAEQSAFLLDDYSPYPNINNLYKDLDKMSSMINIPFHIRYAINGEGYSFERNANIEAFKEMINISSPEFMKFFTNHFLYNYLVNYYEDKEDIMYPVKKTMKKGFIRCDISSDNVPLYDRIMHGLYVNKDEYDKYIGYLSEKDLDNDTYVELKNKLDKVRIKEK